MNCPKHKIKMTLLFTSYVCDVCSPPRGAASAPVVQAADEWCFAWHIDDFKVGTKIRSTRTPSREYHIMEVRGVEFGIKSPEGHRETRYFLEQDFFEVQIYTTKNYRVWDGQLNTIMPVDSLQFIHRGELATRGFAQAIRRDQKTNNVSIQVIGKHWASPELEQTLDFDHLTLLSHETRIKV